MTVESQIDATSQGPLPTARPPSAFGEFWHYFAQNKGAVAGLVVILIVTFAAIFADLIAPYSPSRLSVVNRLKPPSGIYWFGTDEFGRDVFSRTIYAGRLSLLVGASVVAFAAVFGVTL